MRVAAISIVNQEDSDEIKEFSNILFRLGDPFVVAEVPHLSI